MQEFTVTENAARRIKELAKKENNRNLKLRVTVEGGGCSGFRYDFSLDASVQENDIILEKDEARVVVDEISMNFLGGSQLEFEEELGSSKFKVKNPNASAKCGCGNSFSV